MRTYEKSAILEIVKCSKNLNYNDKNQVKETLIQANKNDVLIKTIFGGRFLKRLNAIMNSEDYEHKCVLCERPESGIVCPTCIEQLMPAVTDEPEIALQDEDVISEKKSILHDDSKESMSESKASHKSKHRHNKEQVMADSEWLMDELVRNMDSSMDRLANKKSVQKINRILIVLTFMGIFNTIGIILIILMLKGVIA